MAAAAAAEETMAAAAAGSNHTSDAAQRTAPARKARTRGGEPHCTLYRQDTRRG